MALLAACSGPPRAPVIGEAYVGPSELKLRGDIPPNSPTVALTHHGDRLEILQQRRQVFVRVRAPNGAEGWTDARQLLAAGEMTELRDLAERARTMPAQGSATVYGELRVHTQPSRGSPSFFTIKENDKVDVLTHVTTPRASSPRKMLVAPPPKKTRPAKKPAKPPKYPPPPMPKAPAPPPNWLELSKTDPPLEDDVGPEGEVAAEPPAPVPMDDWSLVRTSRGQCGWALTRALVMAIPDAVAQYAEGHRIVSYFSLGQVLDGDVKKDTWLWTTITGGPQAYDFDSFRVFIWSLRRHRYETAYIERNLKGLAPVLLKSVEWPSQARGKGQPAPAAYPGFSLCVEKADGQRYRRDYALLTNIVRFAGESPCEAPRPVLGVPAAAVSPSGAVAARPQTESRIERLKRGFKDWKKRWFGG